jgi:hypothetical protein
MALLEAPAALKRQFMKRRQEEGVRKFLHQAASKKITQRLPSKARSKSAAFTKLVENLGQPTVARAEKAIEVVEAKAPPFNSQVLGAVQKFAKQLGPETMMVLEDFFRSGVVGETSRGLTASYDGFKVDSSRVSFDHMSVNERTSYERFRAIMATMPTELQAYARELVLEIPRTPHSPLRTPEEIGSEVTGYTDHRRALGAAVALLRVIGWCARSAQGRRA